MRVSQRFSTIILLLVFLMASAAPVFAANPNFTLISNELTADFTVRQAGSGGGGSGSINVPPAAGPPECPFTDISGHWAENQIGEAYTNGLVKGISPAIFAPDRTITRAEFTALLVRTLSLENVNSEGKYQDVEPDKWYSDIINIAANAGIVQGYSSSTFGPDDLITREQMAIMAVRAIKFKGMGKQLNAAEIEQLLAGFSDRSLISQWAKSEVAAALDLGIVTGRTGAVFGPDDNATRAEATVVVNRIYNLVQGTNAKN